MATTKFSLIKLVGVPTAITFLFCLGVALNISPLLRGPAPYPPEWQWQYQFIDTLSRLWAPLIVGIVLIASFFLFERKKQNKILFTARFLIHICLVTLLLQISVLYFSRSGIGVLLERVINPGIGGYFTTALSISSLEKFFSTFVSSVSYFPMRASDHPPFAVLFFSFFLSISRFLSFIFPFAQKLLLHHKDIELLWRALLPYQKVGALVSTGTIVFLGLMTQVPLYFFTKLYYGEKTAIRACFLYSVVPSLSLFLPLNDVFLGLFVMVGFVFLILGEKKNNLFFYFFSGLAFVVGIFFSASLFVPLCIATGTILLERKKMKQKTIRLLNLILGVSSLPLFLFFFYHFNSIAAFIKITGLQAKRSYLPWVFYDIYDFFIFAGIPILFFSIIQVIDIINSLRKSISEIGMAASLHTLYKDRIAVSFFAILLLLDFSGISRAETGRIWMPYMPILTCVIAGFLTKEKRLTTKAFAIILFAQFVQLLTMQEFWVTLW